MFAGKLPLTVERCATYLPGSPGSVIPAGVTTEIVGQAGTAAVDVEGLNGSRLRVDRKTRGLRYPEQRPGKALYSTATI